MSNDMGFPGFGGAVIAIFGVWSVVGIGIYVWYLWSLARLFPMIGLPAAHGWIPIWNQWRLIERGGLPGWTAVLSLIPGLGVVAYVMSVIAMHRLNREHGEGPGMTVLGALVAPLWATLLGSRIQDRGYAGGNTGGRYAAGAGLVEYGADGQVYPLLRPEGSPQPTATQGQFTMPPVPQSFSPQAAAPSADRAAAPVVPPVQRPVAPVVPVAPGATPLPAANRSEAPSPEASAEELNPWGFGKTTEGNFLRLAGEEVPARESGLGAGQDLRPFSWPEARPVRRPDPAPAVPPVAPAVPPAAPAVPPVAPLPQHAQAEPVAPAAPVAPVAPVGQPIVPPVAPPAVPPVVPQVVSTPVPTRVPLPDFWAESEPPSAQAPEEPAPTGMNAASLELDPAGLPFAPPQPEPVAVPQPAPAPAPVPQAAPADAPQAEAAAPQAETAAVSSPEPVAAPPAAPAGVSAQSILGLDEDDDLDSTIVVAKRDRWVLELPGGQQHELVGDDIVVGRKPVAIDGSEVLVVNDPTRTLSKSHARLRRSGETWTIEDLDSTNGVFVTDATGTQVELEPGTAVTVVGDVLIGTLEARLHIAE